jgi:hypothetical protein
MKASTWLRVLAGIMVFFTFGHTMGVLNPPAEGPAGRALDVMRRARFPVMGFERSYWDFYRGFGWFISLEFALFALMAYQLSVMSRHSARAAMPLMVTLEIGCVVTAALSCVYFFAAPIVTSVVAVVCSTAALAALAREAQLEAQTLA